MSNEESLFEPINCEIVDSFVRYTKLKATKGKGEAWLYVGREADRMKFDIFFLILEKIINIILKKI